MARHSNGVYAQIVTDGHHHTFQLGNDGNVSFEGAYEVTSAHQLDIQILGEDQSLSMGSLVTFCAVLVKS